MTATTWSRWDHLGKFMLYITPPKRKGFPNQPVSMEYESRGWRVTRPPEDVSVKHLVGRLMLQVAPHYFVNEVSAYALWLVGRGAPVGPHYVCNGADGHVSPWSTYSPVRLGRVGRPDIVADDEPIYEPAYEWLPLRLQRFATRYTAPRRWLGVPMQEGYAPRKPAKALRPAAWMPPYRRPVHQEIPSVLGNLWTLSRIVAAWKRSGDPTWQQRAEAWRWWRDFRQPVVGHGVVDHGDERDPDRTNPEPRPTITELMRAAGWAGSEKTGWDTTTAAKAMLTYADSPETIERTFWRIPLGDLVFGEFVEWGLNKQGKRTAFPKVGLRQFGLTKKGRLLRPREERGEERQPGTTTIDGVKWPRPQYQKRWASELHSYLGLRGAVPYFAEPYQRPINPPEIGYGEKEYPRSPVRQEVEDARNLLVVLGIDGSVPLAEARANAGLPPLPEKPAQTHAERHAEFEARLARYRAGETIRLVEPRDLGDAIILGVRKDGSVMTKIWRGGMMNPRATKPTRIEPDGWIVNDIDRGNPDERSTESPDDIEAGGLFLPRLGGHVEILDQAITAVTSAEIARGKGLAPEYAKVEGARMVDRALDSLYAILHPVAGKTRAPVADNDNEEIMQNIAA